MLSAGVRLGSYEIVEPLQEGGMGHVYVARDGRLGRTVVVKTLRDDAVERPDAVTRFRNEARAASALNHPAIVHIYEIGEAAPAGIGGSENPAPLLYIAMEHVRGATLRERFERGASESEIVEWMACLCEALAKAHEAGILHRDLKPDNIMITDDGFVKVLDFGLAKLTEALQEPFDMNSGTAPLTSDGIIVGTAPYMSPEQLRGAPASSASDLFAVGCMLFEGLAGQHPFTRSTLVETIHAIGYDKPPDLRRLAPRVSPHLAEIVFCLLRKDPAERYNSAKEVADDLRAVQRDERPKRVRSNAPRALVLAMALLIIGALGIAMIVLHRPPSPAMRVANNAVAVLPFANRSNDPTTDYLSDGFTESLIYDLSRSRSLRVVPRSSVFAVAKKESDPRGAGRRLGVGSVVVGEITTRGSQLVVRAELIDVQNGALLWGARYDRDASALASLQSEMSRDVRNALGHDALPATTATTDAEAFRHYLRGRYFWNKRTAEGLQTAIGEFHEALDRDPAFALAWVGLGDSYALLEQYAGIPSSQNCPKAKEAILRAQQLDPNLAQPHASLGLLYAHCEWNWTASEQSFREALRLDPNYATAYHWYALHLAYRREFARGAENARRAQQLDPLSLIANNALSVVYGYEGEWERVLEQSDRLIEMDRSFPVAHLWRGRALRAMGRHDEAIAELTTALELSGGRSRETMGELGSAYAIAGRADEARKWIAKLESDPAAEAAAAYPIATIHAALGEKQKALQWLDRAFAAHAWFLVQIEVEPLFAPLRGDRHFEELVRRVRNER